MSNGPPLGNLDGLTGKQRRDEVASRCWFGLWNIELPSKSPGSAAREGIVKWPTSAQVSRVLAYRRTASSSSPGRFVAAMISSWSLGFELTPSNRTARETPTHEQWFDDVTYSNSGRTQEFRFQPPASLVFRRSASRRQDGVNLLPSG